MIPFLLDWGLEEFGFRIMLRAWIVVLVRFLPNKKAPHDMDFPLQLRLTNLVPGGSARPVNILPEASLTHSGP